MFKSNIVRFFLFGSIGVLLLGALAVLGFFYAVKAGAFGALPTDQELKEIRNFEASDVYSADEVLLGRYFVENRSHVELKEVSPYVIKGLVATEDARFYAHQGIDQVSLMRVLFKSVILQQKTGGGSTISQQLIKNLFGRQAHGIFTMPVAKIKEGLLANKLNELYTKEEILELYLNTVSFGEDTYGIETASERFFNTKVKNLRPEQAAVLIGMLKAPTTYNPRLYPSKSLSRRNTVLALMRNNQVITEQKFNELIERPLVLDYKRSHQKTGDAAYFRAHIQSELTQILSKTKKNNGNPYNIHQDGLKIFTTINSTLQAKAEKAIQAHMNYLTKKLRKESIGSLKSGAKKHLVNEALVASDRYKTISKTTSDHQLRLAELSKPVQTSLFTFGGRVDTLISPRDSVIHSICLFQCAYLAIDPTKGSTLAYIGGNDQASFPFDRVHAKRQVGSTFKPFIYAKALASGSDICDEYKNEPIVYTQYQNWKPKNSDNTYGGKYSMIGALTHSVNTVSVQVLMEQGIDETIKYCQQLGIHDTLPRVPSLALGVANLSLWTMVEAYSVLANKGKKQPLYCIEQIQNSQGEVIYTHDPLEAGSVMDAAITDQITYMMQSVVDSGSAKRLRTRYGFRNQIAGKTGTTQNQTDGWFVGYTPHFLAMAWVGADQPAIRFQSIREGQGANMALPVWAEVFKTIRADPRLTRTYAQPFDHRLQSSCAHYTPDKEGFLRELFRRKRTKTNEADGLKKEEKRSGWFGKWRKK